ncbi:MAG: ABC transporter substrate-binding protein [Deltaproteobacteria bacterium]|nr:ABC transporter substrate-binding protein [Deltaproteobacteria bacterium]
MTLDFRRGGWRAAFFLLLLAGAAAAAGLSDAERRGKRIYLEGKGRHRISAFLLSAGIKAPGSGFPCINCHLSGGTGQLEGGVQSADISWFHLTKEFSGKRPSGRAHPAYNEESVMTAVTSGLDPASNDLDIAHPRYEMEREDLEDLVAYLKVMDREPVPGVTDNEVRVGILLPEKGPLAEAGREVRSLLKGYFTEGNARGGLYSRSIVLVPVPFDPYREDGALSAVRKAVESEDVFCFLANVGRQSDDEAARYLATKRVPVLVPLLSAPESGYETGRYAFHVFASIRDQARVMTDFLAERLRKPGNRVGLLYAQDSSGRAGAEGTKEQMRKHELALAGEESFPPGTFSAAEAVKRLREKSVDAILYFGGPREAIAFARVADSRGWRPLFVAPAPMVGDALQTSPPGFLGSVYLASPFEAPDSSSRKMAEFFRLGEKYGVGKGHRTFQFLAYSGAILLEEGLKRSGRGVTREKLVDSIGNVWKLETGVTPPLTYTPNRRAGAIGAAIRKVDPDSRRLLPAVPWREPK